MGLLHQEDHDDRLCHHDGRLSFYQEDHDDRLCHHDGRLSCHQEDHCDHSYCQGIALRSLVTQAGLESHWLQQVPEVGSQAGLESHWPPPCANTCVKGYENASTEKMNNTNDNCFIFFIASSFNEGLRMSFIQLRKTFAKLETTVMS